MNEKVNSREDTPKQKSLLEKAEDVGKMVLERIRCEFLARDDYIKTPKGFVKVTRDEKTRKCRIGTMPDKEYDNVLQHFGKTYVRSNGKQGLLNPDCTAEELPTKYDPSYDSIEICGNGKYITKINGNKGVSGTGGIEIIPHKYKYIESLVTGKHYAVKSKDTPRRSVVDENNKTIIEGEYEYISSKKLNGFDEVFIAEDSKGEVSVTKTDGTKLIDHKKVANNHEKYGIYAFDGHLVYVTEEGGKEITNLQLDGEDPIKLYNAKSTGYINPSNEHPLKQIRKKLVEGNDEKIDQSRIVIKSFTLTPNGKEYKNKKGFTADKIRRIINKETLKTH